VLFPRSTESYPQVSLFEKMLRREAQLMAAALGGPEIDDPDDTINDD
jgi:hypothetical protein